MTIETLSFYLEESVARMLNIELEYLKELEIKKMRLAQTVEWKFMTVYKLIATGSPNQSIDAPL
jgi:aminopeptidase C